MNRSVVVAGVVFVAVMAALGTIAAWPIYASATSITVAVVATVVAAALALVSARWRWRPLVTAGAVLLAWAVVGVGVAVPERWANGTVWPGALLDLVSGPVTGWKDLATVPLPVGEYRNLLVPLATVFLLSVFFALRAGWRTDLHALWAVPIAAAMPLFGLLFGRTSTSAPLQLGDIRIMAPVELATGIIGLLAAVLWLAWRERHARRVALRTAAAASGLRSGNRLPAGALLRRSALAGVMLIVALVAGVIVTPALAETRVRSVVRAAVGPDLSQTVAASPLSDYRASFTDTRFGATLFSIAADGPLPDRIKIATLDAYDGEAYRTAAGPEAFQRVPDRLSPPAGEQVTATITIDGLTGPWLPSFGELERISFAGPDAQARADAFYYDRTTGTALEADGVFTGDQYTITATTQPEGNVAAQASPGATPTVEAPPQLAAWLEAQGAPRTGAGLADTISALRARGYLSHALLQPAAGTAWVAALGDGYAFRASTAGHSLARVDQLFQQLLERENHAGENASDAELVAAVGDDEQFAVAAAIIAEQFGFPARVVLGFRTEPGALPACTDGVCPAGALSAWIEVQTRLGDWVSIDTTPQHVLGVNSDAQRERDPEVVTDVRPATADEVAPPEPQRQVAAEAAPPTKPSPAADVVWIVVRWMLLGLLALIVVVAPFLAIIVAKALRRRRRRSQTPRTAVLEGWNEYVDTAVDSGRPAPKLQTRTELAISYATPGAAALAAVADHADFSDEPVDAADAARFWEAVAAERGVIRSEIGWWHRVRAALSLKSFARHPATRHRTVASARARTSEGRKQRTRVA